jgi:histone-lysine N-methyltransferase SETD2
LIQVRKFPKIQLDVNPEECACGPSSKCINRELLIECNSDECPAGAYCQNQRFQKLQYATVKVVACGPKGHGLCTTEDLKG